VHLGSAHSRARPARPSGPAPLGRFGLAEEIGEGGGRGHRRRRRPILVSRRPEAGGEVRRGECQRLRGPALGGGERENSP
jgi:hypothetical protein